MKMKFFVYLLECRDGTFYCGYTKDLEKRLEQHNSGRGGKYTQRKMPVKLIYSEQFETQKEAMRRELKIKKLSRKEKFELIR